MAGRGKVKRLMSGPSLSWFARSSLWLEEDHLLSVEQRGSQERYRRFHFEDVQALVICGTERRLWIGLVLGALLGIGFVVALASRSTEGQIFGGGLMALSACLLVINLAKGAGCVCHLRTQVSSTKLPAVKRLNKFERVLPRLTERIVERQGQREPEEMVVEYQARRDAAAVSAASPPVPGAGRPSAVAATVSAPVMHSGKLHFALFALLLADALLALFTFIGNHPVLVGLRMLVVMGALFCGIVAMARYKPDPGFESLRTWTVVATVYLVVGAIGVYVAYVAMPVRYPQTTHNTVEIFRYIAATGPFDGVGWLLFFTLNAGISGLLGAIGLLQTLNYRAREEKVVAPPLPSKS